MPNGSNRQSAAARAWRSFPPSLPDKEQGAEFGRRDQSLAPALQRAGDRAALKAEHLGFEDAVGNGAATQTCAGQAWHPWCRRGSRSRSPGERLQR